jgi:RNA polymerase sigma-70 factor (family 1)
MARLDCLQPNDVIKDLQMRFALYEDMKAYKELYILLFDGLHRFSFSLIKSSEGAEEIVSDVFIKLWQIRDQLNKIENLKVYLYTITKNFSLNYITKNSKNPVVHLEQMNIKTVLEFKSPEDLFISAEAVGNINKVIHSLPPQCKLIFQLVKEEGLKYKEVASVLNISVFTVRNQLAIAIRKIGEALPQNLRFILQIQGRFSES